MYSFWHDLKIPFFTILFLLIGLFLYTKLAGPIPFAVTSVQTTNSNPFTVTGEGKVSGVPSKATVNLGVTKTATTEQLATDEVNRITNQIVTDLKALGIAEKDIKTTNFSVYPNSEERTEPLTLQAPAGREVLPQSYTASQNLTIQVDSVDLANKAVDTATQNGANQIGGVNFEIDDEKRTEMETEARKLAIADAKKKAQSLATDAGITLGKVINIQESSNQPYPMAYGRAAEMSAVKDVATNLQPGENDVIVTVTLFYETQ